MVSFTLDKQSGSPKRISIHVHGNLIVNEAELRHGNKVDMVFTINSTVSVVSVAGSVSNLQVLVV